MNRILLTAVGLLAAALCLTACGSAGHGAAASSSPNIQDQMVRFAQCLRRHGLNVPDPQAGQGVRIEVSEADKAKGDAAMQACRAYAPAKVGDPNDPKVRDRMLKTAQCLRRHGLDVPDPQPGQPLDIRSNARSQQVQDVIKACQAAGGGGPLLQHRS